MLSAICCRRCAQHYMAYFTNAIFYLDNTPTDRLWTCMVGGNAKSAPWQLPSALASGWRLVSCHRSRKTGNWWISYVVWLTSNPTHNFDLTQVESKTKNLFALQKKYSHLSTPRHGNGKRTQGKHYEWRGGYHNSLQFLSAPFPYFAPFFSGWL